MDRIPQTNNLLSPRYNRYGCLYRIVLGIGEEESGKALTVAQLNRFEADHVDRKAVNARSLGLDNGRSYIDILHDVFNELGVNGGGNQVATMIDGNFNYWGSEPIRWDYLLVNHHAGTPDGHWLLADKYGGEIFNPDPSITIGPRKQLFFIQLWGV